MRVVLSGTAASTHVPTEPGLALAGEPDPEFLASILDPSSEDVAGLSLLVDTLARVREEGKDLSVLPAGLGASLRVG